MIAPGVDQGLFDLHRRNVSAGPDYDDGSNVPQLPANPPARLIAFFLPQFHAIPENDEWWGPGFTEWTNVTRALPLFEGHYQPRLPGALGFYDLSNPETLRNQSELARSYGIEGFCFHHYWFGGRRLLERPLDLLLADPSIELPFCINWANESWSRRWDGREKEILIAQNHSPEDDLAFAEHIRPMFDDRRYIRVGGRPLLSLYRPSLLPGAAATVDRWRTYFRSSGEDPLILMVQGFDFDPSPFGMDGAIGFPPWGAPKVEPVPIGKHLAPGVRSWAYPYEDVARASLEYEPQGFRFFPAVCPDWDNSARRDRDGSALVGSSPALYEWWLRGAIERTAALNPEGERLLFINAWNEWAEGAYLEPDRRNGFAYLAATARALSGRSAGSFARPTNADSRSARQEGLVRSAARRASRTLRRLADAFDRL